MNARQVGVQIFKSYYPGAHGEKTSSLDMSWAGVAGGETFVDF